MYLLLFDQTPTHTHYTQQQTNKKKMPQLVSLPADLARLTQLTEKQIDVSRNKLLTPPMHVIKSGQWLGYLRDTLAQASECFRLKVMLVGRENVGKTYVHISSSFHINTLQIPSLSLLLLLLI
jgi:hypothetical protein